MARFISLKTKVSLFLVASAVLLMGSLLTFFYLSGRKSLVAAARREIAADAQLLAEDLHMEVENSFLELSSLQYQLELAQIGEGEEISREDLWGRFVTQFLANSARKYQFLLFRKPEWSQFLQVQPTKIFGGETRTQFDWKKRPPIPNKILENPGDSLSKIPFGGQVVSQNRLLYLKLSPDHRRTSLVLAALSLDVFPEQALDRLHLPQGVTARVLEPTGLILFSPRKSEINRFLHQAIPQLSAISKKTGYWRHENRVYYSNMLSPPSLRLIFEKDLTSDFQTLNATLLRMIFFASVMLLLVFLIVWLMAKRMTDTLKEVSVVATHVAGGDFSKKIAIRRQDELGVLIQTFNTMIDRTRSSYESLRVVNQELSEKVAELTRTRAELSQKQRLAIIGETISKISHEIQNKIGGVSIWLQNLEMELKGNPTARVYIDEMQTALRSFLDMLTHFKRFYREPKLEKRPISVSEVLDAVLRQLTEEIRSKGLTIEREEDVHPPRLQADPRQLEEALLNIVINAIYYSPPGGTIGIRAKAAPDKVTISISDEGPGVPAEHAKNLFQPFFTTKSSGSGLGLALADSIVRAHGGRISFGNLPEKGTQFTIDLPRKSG